MMDLIGLFEILKEKMRFEDQKGKKTQIWPK